MGSWTGQVAVITGAASGIGRGLTEYALGQGMVVYAADVDKARLAELADHSALHRCELDVSDAAQIERLAERVFAEQGKVNLLFNNAGVLVDGKSWERTEQDWRWCLDINVMGVVNGLRSFVPRMLAQDAPARIINTSSIGGLLGGGPFMAIYQSCKHAITAITETLYQELLMEAAPVTASVLCPGEVATDIWFSDRLRDALAGEGFSQAEAGFRAALEDRVAAGMTPDAFAEEVFKGIEAGQFWLLPGDDITDMLRQRVDDIGSGAAPAPLFQ